MKPIKMSAGVANAPVKKTIQLRDLLEGEITPDTRITVTLDIYSATMGAPAASVVIEQK